MSNVTYVRDRSGHCSEAHSRAARLHTRHHYFEGASSQLVEYMDLCAVMLWDNGAG